MTFTFNIISDEVENFKRVIVVDSSATFMELKNAICDSVGYDKNQFCSFFLCEGNWEKRVKSPWRTWVQAPTKMYT